jgi:two-component system response regulator YesN
LGKSFGANPAAHEPFEEVKSIIQNVKILVVDNDSGIRELVVNTLTYCVNREVLSFETSQAAWEYLEQGNPADMVLCDVDMPNSGGFELMAKIKKHAPEKIFIIMSGQERNEKKAGFAGADAFLGKPFAINDLFNLVQSFVVD